MLLTTHPARNNQGILQTSQNTLYDRILHRQRAIRQAKARCSVVNLPTFSPNLAIFQLPMATNLATFPVVIGDFSGILETDVKACIVPPQFRFRASSLALPRGPLPPQGR